MAKDIRFYKRVYYILIFIYYLYRNRKINTAIEKYHSEFKNFRLLIRVVIRHWKITLLKIILCFLFFKNLAGMNL